MASKKDQGKAGGEEKGKGAASAPLSPPPQQPDPNAPAPEALSSAAPSKPDPTPALPSKRSLATKSERRVFEVTADVLHDGEPVKPGEAIAITRADFDQLKVVGVVTGEWGDGEAAKS